MQQAMVTMKILCNPNRLIILSLLLGVKKDLCVNQIAEKVGISQSLASHQLSYLEVRGIVENIRMGQTTCYVLSSSSLAKKVVKVIKLLK